MCGTAGYWKGKTHSAGGWHVELLELVLNDCQLSTASQAGDRARAASRHGASSDISSQDCAMRRGDGLSSQSISDTQCDKTEQKSEG